MKKWSEDEINFIIKEVKCGKTYEEISITLGRTKSSIKNKLIKLGYSFKSQQKSIIKCCIQCGEITKNPKFCDRSCSAKYNNKHYPKRVSELSRFNWNCLLCGVSLKLGGKFCCSEHFHQFNYDQTIKIWKETGYIGISALKKYLKLKYNYSCSNCGIQTWNENPITLELEHKDGNYKNNKEENVCLLCPNCHSQTPTYKSKNKGNGRHYRRVRYDSGKSF